MAKIIGTHVMDFKARDGSQISGAAVWFTTEFPETATGCDGVQAEKVWLSAETLSRMGTLPDVGDEVTPVYNKYGKVTDFLYNQRSDQ